MRPLRLAIKGFGPYKEKTVIDFESLGTGGMYLITGDTGSGKTFLFDAITFALYGEMSGSSRDSRSARSQFSADDDTTEVELDFEYRGKRYSISRNPEYIRRKKSGEGFTKQTAGAVLTYPDGSVTDGASKATEAIRDILGIDAGQFSSIAMIAQGEFRKVLTAGTDERQKLFRKLFNTQPYNRLMEELSDRSGEIRREFEDRERDLRAAFMSAECSFDEGLSEELRILRDEKGFSAAGIDEIKDLFERMIKAGEIKAGEIAGRLTEADSEINKLSSRIALAEQYRKNTSDLENLKKAYAGLENALTDAKKASEEAEAKLPYIVTLEREAALLDSGMDSYSELDAANIRQKEITEIIDKTAADIEAKQTERDSLAEAISAGESELENLRSANDELAALKAEMEKLEGRIRILDSLRSEAARLSLLEKDLQTLQDEYRPLEDEASRLEKTHIELRSSYMKEQAGILASGLEEGEACPVCGSTHHPAPAALSAEAPTADEIDAAEKAAEEARKISNEKWNAVRTSMGTLKEAESSVLRTAKEVLGEEDPGKAYDLAGSEIAKINGSLAKMGTRRSELEKNKKRAAEIAGILPEKKKALEDLSEEAEDLRAKASELNKELAASASKYQTLRAGLRFGSKEEAEKERDSKSKEAEELRENMRITAGSYSAAVSALNENKARTGELEKIVKGFTPDDEDLARDQKRIAEERKKSLSDEEVVLASELKTVRSSLAAIAAGEDELKKIRSRHAVVDSLYRTASGGLSGKERITLEAYVQAFYFDRIIRHANLRLLMMSDGQYEFVRSEESGDKRQKFGLDLNVVDHYTGRERAVSTLSGGESFMASLSLALGLSDEVQASSGGIRLDTMFIDEGFGSLDSETLEKAVRTLTRLADEDKLVGIISHVDALASRIDKQIIVKKDRISGSHVSIVV